MTDASASPPPATLTIPRGLFLLSILYGGMTCIAGVLGAKQVAIGPISVEAGIFPFLMLVGLSSAVAEVYGKGTANRLVRFGFVPLITAIALTFIVLQLPTDPEMYEPAKEAFPIILGQSGRMMAAGVIAYGVSVTLNVLIFSRIGRPGKLVAIRAALASVVSQIVDTLLFITISFYGVRPIGQLLIGQATAKVVLSIGLVPLIILLFVMLARHLDGRPISDGALDRER
ncbi:queuosine precursor transporter [Sphingomonas rhizophila]|uniref:Probable queuosine precursor transporter n=1 Tax=Sphingomonas rhizophila TaxID=2071607 RepID=A0A7G9SCR5_9SPHN|nr:queuosine precursor transporter [Sphingomonas rhizophila]QNN65640.1 queuosine precursor transporter [Sphingomonas rhizophila]